MASHRASGTRGFVNAELLVLVGFGALLLVLAMPLLTVQRERQRITQCLGNLGHIMRAQHSLLTDTNDQFELTPADIGPCSWGQLGQTSHEWWLTEAPSFYIPGQQRPLNVYVLGAQLETDVVHDGVEIVRTPVPPAYCSSDRLSHQRNFWTSGVPTLIPSYEDVGTSYHLNFGLTHRLSNYIDSWDDLYRTTIADFRAGRAAELMWFYEDPLDFAWRDNAPLFGSHGEFNMHTAAYLDGHADYLYRDTRRNCGPGWTVLNRAWLRRPGYTPEPYRYSSSVDCDFP